MKSIVIISFLALYSNLALATVGPEGNLPEYAKDVKATYIGHNNNNRLCVVSADYANTPEVNEQGRVGCWNQSTDTKVTWISGITSATEVFVGLSHACALLADDKSTSTFNEGGTMKCWGENFFGQLGNNTKMNSPTTGVSVLNLKNVVRAWVVWGNSMCATVRDDPSTTDVNESDTKCWGLNPGGHIGINAKEICAEKYPCSRKPVSLVF